MAFIESVIEEVQISRTVELLGGRHTLHRPVRSRLEAHDLLQEGLPGHALKHLVNHVEIFRSLKDLIAHICAEAVAVLS